MKRIAPDAAVHVREVARAWKSLKTATTEIERRGRAAIAEEIAGSQEVQMARAEVTEMLQAAHAAGTTKTVLKELTTKDHLSFQDHFLGPEQSFLRRSIPHPHLAWIDGKVWITMDPRLVVDTEWDRSRPELWSAVVTPVDLSAEDVRWATDTTPEPSGVLEWLGSAANRRVIEHWLNHRLSN